MTLCVTDPQGAPGTVQETLSPLGEQQYCHDALFWPGTCVDFSLSFHSIQDLLHVSFPFFFFFFTPVLINLFIIFRLQKLNKLTELSLLLQFLPKMNKF